MENQGARRISQYHDGDSTNSIIIIGGGIVGSAIAHHLSSTSAQLNIIVLEASLSPLLGSTGPAPGLVGQLNELEVLTTLAVESVRQYSVMPNAFTRVGGLEIASSPEGIEALRNRAQLAQRAGLRAHIISSEEASELAPQFHQSDQVSSALHFMDDGTADPLSITREYQRLAKSDGVKLIEAKVQSLVVEDSELTGVETSVGFFAASRVILATGIWTSGFLLNTLGINLPIVPVAHPYSKGPTRPPRSKPSPFVRYPEHRVYARDHGSYDGFGSYNHPPIISNITSATAIDAWIPEFDAVLASATKHFPECSDFFEKATLRPLNGIFAMTPDGLPLVGEMEKVKGLWVAGAIWITHAGGVARLLANLITGKEVDENVREALDPNRFKGQSERVLRDQSLSRYNNIWNSKDAK